MNAPAKTLPGTIPGLLREGSPVLIPHLGKHAWTVLFVEESHQGPFVHVGRKSVSRLVPLTTEEPVNKVLLSLEDPTGFLHAKLWLWGKLSKNKPPLQPLWHHIAGRWCLNSPGEHFIVDADSFDPTEALHLACLQKAGL